jgi:murein DD-endopeptidase MepM/ murein hydrolase activator NlpD
MGRRLKGLTLVLLPDDGAEPRSVHFSARKTRWIFFSALFALVGVVAMASSWWYLALQTGRSMELRSRVDSLETERVQLLRVAEELGRVEAEYERLRSLFGPASDPVSSGLWLPPSGLPGGGRNAEQGDEEQYLPTSWPLTEAGFVTQNLVEGGSEEHPGLDIAVGTGSYVRAAGTGEVLRVGEDPVYGLFVVLDHGEGYQTVYGHVSMILVGRGKEVRKNEVIALSGSTGRSTAAHLHFEILHDGTPVDPFSMVEQPG